MGKAERSPPKKKTFKVSSKTIVASIENLEDQAEKP